MELDNTDIQILEQLLEDGRASRREIAEALQISPSTVSSRFQKLKDENIIQRFQPILDYEKLGYGLTAIIDVSVDAGPKDSVMPAMKSRKNVASAYIVTGETDLMLICKFLDREDMSDFLDELESEDGVLRTNTSVVLESQKENGRLDLERLKD